MAVSGRISGRGLRRTSRGGFEAPSKSFFVPEREPRHFEAPRRRRVRSAPSRPTSVNSASFATLFVNRPAVGVHMHHFGERGVGENGVDQFLLRRLQVSAARRSAFVGIQPN
jgi:hypothetical protein